MKSIMSDTGLYIKQITGRGAHKRTIIALGICSHKTKIKEIILLYNQLKTQPVDQY